MQMTIHGYVMNNVNSTIAIVWIFNYDMPDNIKKLKAIYSKKFSNMWFALPHCEFNYEEHIFPYNSHSYYFENAFYKFSEIQLPENIKTIIFIGDDVLLNPSINENNILKKLNLNDDEAFVQNAFPYSNYMLYSGITKGNFPSRDISRTIYTLNQKIELFSKMDDENNSHNKFLQLFSGFSIQSLVDDKAIQNFINKKMNIDNMLNCSNCMSDKFKTLLTVCISDFLIVPRISLNKFGKYAKIYGENKIFVEYATLPCLLHAIEPKKIKSFCTQPIFFRFFAENFINQYNQFDPYKYFSKCIHNIDIKDVLSKFPKDLFGIHQVKLSKYIC